MAHLTAFKSWLRNQGPGCGFHSDVDYVPDGSGYSIRTTALLPSNSTIVTLPFTGAITIEVAKSALAGLCEDPSALNVLSERQLICAYICTHSAFSSSDLENSTNLTKPDESRPFRHGSYIATLPAPSDLRTPLHWTEAELNATKGSNLYKATLERITNLQQEHAHLCSIMASARTDPRLTAAMTWQSYLTASTYLSSRAFPSTLLSSTPSLQPTPTSYPVLLPGIDAANHARGSRVTWSVSSAADSSGQLCISLITHDALNAGQEVFNNYGPKPNSELILGYGFALPDNPDDTIVLAIGGAPGSEVRRHEVGRNAIGGDAIFEEVRSIVGEDIEGEDKAVWEAELDAADALEDMIGASLEALPLSESLDEHGMEIREEVKVMLKYYLQGQQDILQDMLTFTQKKREEALDQARQAGVTIVDNEEDDIIEDT